MRLRKNFNNKKVQRLFYDEIIATKERIEVQPGECRYNYRCHNNAVHEAVKNEDDQIAMVVYMDLKDVDPIIHFVNYKDGQYVDNTLGQWATRHEYYLIRYIDSVDFWSVQYIFNAYRRTIRKNLSWWLRLTSNIDF